MKNIKFKRITAYLIDYLIITILVTLLHEVNFINPYRKEYDNAVTQQQELLKDFKIEEPDDLDMIYESKKMQSLTYDIRKYGTSYIITEIVVILLYFTVFPYCFDGQTIGKKLVKIKNINNNRKGKVSVWKYFLKSMILPLYSGVYFTSVISSLVSFITLFIFKTRYIFDIDQYIMAIITIWGYADIVSFLVRKDKKPLHDVIFKTDVVMLDEKEGEL